MDRVHEEEFEPVAPWSKDEDGWFVRYKLPGELTTKWFHRGFSSETHVYAHTMRDGTAMKEPP